MEQIISKTVNKWLKEEQRPALLRVIRANDPWEGMSDEEIEDHIEFIHWYLNKDYELLLLIPTHPRETYIWFSDEEEFRTSAFGTNDFQTLQQPLNKYGYRIKKILERVKDLGIQYSCLTTAEGREDILIKYENLVNREFREKLLNLVERYQGSTDIDKKMLLKGKIARESRHIIKCKEVWQKYSTWE